MTRFKDKLSLVLVAIIYILFTLRFDPERLSASLGATAMQVFSTAPYVFGMAFLAVSFLQRAAGGRLPWDRMLRIYFTIGIIVGFFYALNDYWIRG